MYYTLAAAAAATGLSENTILKAVEGGAITGTKDLFGEWRIERDELHRSHAPVAQGNTESGAARSPAASDSADLETEIEALIKKAGNALRQQADQPPPARDSGRSIACQFPAVSTGQPEAATKSIQALLRLRRGAGARFIPRDRIGAAVPERDSAWGDHVRARRPDRDSCQQAASCRTCRSGAVGGTRRRVGERSGVVSRRGFAVDTCWAESQRFHSGAAARNRGPSYHDPQGGPDGSSECTE